MRCRPTWPRAPGWRSRMPSCRPGIHARRVLCGGHGRAGGPGCRSGQGSRRSFGGGATDRQVTQSVQEALWAGVAALEGRYDVAVAGFRQSVGRLRDLGVSFNGAQAAPERHRPGSSSTGRPGPSPWSHSRPPDHRRHRSPARGHRGAAPDPAAHSQPPSAGRPGGLVRTKWSTHPIAVHAAWRTDSKTALSGPVRDWEGPDS